MIALALCPQGNAASYLRLYEERQAHRLPTEALGEGVCHKVLRVTGLHGFVLISLLLRKRVITRLNVELHRRIGSGPVSIRSGAAGSHQTQLAMLASSGTNTLPVHVIEQRQSEGCGGCGEESTRRVWGGYGIKDGSQPTRALCCAAARNDCVPGVLPIQRHCHGAWREANHH